MIDLISTLFNHKFFITYLNLTKFRISLNFLAGVTNRMKSIHFCRGSGSGSGSGSDSDYGCGGGGGSDCGGCSSGSGCSSSSIRKLLHLHCKTTAMLYY